jgi:DNA polymerase-4
MNRIILHIDMDAFFASVEQAINPALRGKPVLVGSRRKKHNTVVAACSYEAKKYGIESGMSSFEALARCPSAVFVPCDSSRYMYTSDRIAAMLRGCSDRMERASIDEFNLDMTGPGGMEAAVSAAARIREHIRAEFHINGSAGIASSRTIAKIAAKAGKPDGLTAVPPGGSEAFLADRPVEKVPGIGTHLTQYLHEMCVFTIAELFAVSRERLCRRFGKTGLWMYQVIRGMDDDRIEFASTRVVAEPEAAPGGP